jgi:hypothetical protein
MRAALRFVIGFAAAAALSTAGTAAGYHTQFVTNNCNWAAPTPINTFTRDASITVALYARHEGYQWGGMYLSSTTIAG